MRRSYFLFRIILSLCAVLSVRLVYGQKSDEPEFKWKVYYLNNDVLTPLEALPYTKEVKGGISKNKALVAVKEKKSTLRFTTPPIFAVKVADNELDPDEQIRLYKMEERGGKRTTVLKTVGNISKTTSLQMTEPLSFARYGDNCLVIKADALQPGEYGFFLPFSTQLFLFGID